MSKPEHLLWAHIDTTGLDPTKDQILEMYMRVTDLQGNEPQGERCFHSGLRECLASQNWAPEIIRMHTRSGLLTDWQEGRLPTFTDLDADVLACLNELQGDIYLAGYAPHFVREFMRFQTPKSAARLHFQQINVTSLEKFIDTTFMRYPRPQALRVRAKVDAALQQYRDYLELIRMLKNG